MHATEENRPEVEVGTGTVARAQLILTLLPTPVLIAVALVMVAIIHALIVLVIAAILCVAWAVFIRRITASTEDRVLSMFDAREVDAATHARLFNVVEGLCLTLGMTRPRILSVESEALIAAAVTGPDSVGSLVVSSGLTASLDRMEHEALAAHLLCRLRSGDVLARSLMIACADALAGVGLSSLALSILGKSGELMSPHEADAAACAVTRYPPGLMSALDKIAGSAPLSGGSIAGTVALWVAVPGGDAPGGGRIPIVGGVRLSIDERIELLKEI